MEIIIDDLVVVNERRQGDRRKKNSFIMYYDWFEHFSLLKDDELGILIRLIFEYVLEKDIDEAKLSDKSKMAFSFIKKQLDKDKIKYDNICEQRSMAGKMGGRRPKDIKSK